MNAYEQMMSRIENEPTLEAYRATLTYDWPNTEEHYEWVATAPLEEIIAWCETVEAESAE